MSFSNPHRGEYPLTINQQPHILRLSLHALAQIEHQLQQSLSDVAQQTAAGQLSAQQASIILTAAWRAGSHPQATLEDLQHSDLCYASACTAVMRLLELAFGG